VAVLKLLVVSKFPHSPSLTLVFKLKLVLGPVPLLIEDKKYYLGVVWRHPEFSMLHQIFVGPNLDSCGLVNATSHIVEILLFLQNVSNGVDDI
jgi:hypothetical protein